MGTRREHARAAEHGPGDGARRLGEEGMVSALVRRCVFPPADGPVCCAVSGGTDSLALLVLAVEAGHEVTA
ncbi:MAG: tRNA lysidine(34) synthetase TilS, partial [Acidimicrobiales bacterium]